MPSRELEREINHYKPGPQSPGNDSRRQPAICPEAALEILFTSLPIQSSSITVRDTISLTSTVISILTS